MSVTVCIWSASGAQVLDTSTWCVYIYIYIYIYTLILTILIIFNEYNHIHIIILGCPGSWSASWGSRPPPCTPDHVCIIIMFTIITSISNTIRSSSSSSSSSSRSSSSSSSSSSTTTTTTSMNLIIVILSYSAMFIVCYALLIASCLMRVRSVQCVLQLSASSWGSDPAPCTTKILHAHGFDSVRILFLRGGITQALANRQHSRAKLRHLSLRGCFFWRVAARARRIRLLLGLSIVIIIIQAVVCVPS